MKLFISIILFILPFFALCQNWTEIYQGIEKLPDSTGSINFDLYDKNPGHAVYLSYSFPKDFDTNALVIVLLEADDRMIEKSQKKYNEIFSGTVLVLNQSDFDESTHKAKLYRYIIDPKEWGNQKKIGEVIYRAPVLTMVDRLIGKKYELLIKEGGGYFYCIKKYLKMWNDRITM